MKRKPLLLASLLSTGIACAGGQGISNDMLQWPTVQVGDIRVVSDLSGLYATRSSRELWRSTAILGAQLAKGPGRWVTAIGMPTTLTPEFKRELQAEGKGRPTDPRHSFVIDPFSGRIVAEVWGLLVREQAGTAVFLQVNGANSDKNSVFAVLTTLPLDTLRLKIKLVRSASLVPTECVETSKEPIPKVGSEVIRVSSSSYSETIVISPFHINITNSKCDLQFKLDLDTLNVTLLSFKPLK